MHHQRRTVKYSIFHSAGWLFADLFLALTIIFIAASATGRPITQTKLTIVPTATPTPSPTPTPLPQTIDTHPLDFSINTDPLQLDQSSIIAQVKIQMNQSQDNNRNVGIVLTFAGGPDGVNHAASFNAILRSIPNFANSIFKNYHDLANQPSEFDLEIYFFTR